MNRRHYLLTVVLSLAAGLAGHALYAALAAPTAARAAAGPRRDAQWEYCAVVKAQAGTPRLIYWIQYFRGEGSRPEAVEARLEGYSQVKAIAKLGEEGWEMVGEGPYEAVPVPGVRPPGTSANAPTAVFFKRRKE